MVEQGELAALIERYAPTDGDHKVCEKASLHRASQPSEPTHGVFGAAVCVVAQGRKQVLSGGSVLPFYFIAGFMTPTKPPQFELADREERKFWQGVRASPTRTAHDIRSRFKDIDRRLADIESYVTTENRSLAREIEQLR